MNKKIYISVIIVVHIFIAGSFNLYFEGEEGYLRNKGNMLVVIWFNLFFMAYFFIFTLKNGGFKKGMGIIHAIVSGGFSLLVFYAMMFQPYRIYLPYDRPYRIYTFWYYPSLICTVVLAYIQISYYLRYSQPNVEND